MTKKLSNYKLVKLFIVLTLILFASSRKNKHKLPRTEVSVLDSVSVESNGLEDSFEICLRPGLLRMDLTGQLRRTMVYHVAMSTKKSTICSPISALLPLGKLMMGSSSRNYQELKKATGYRRSKVEEKFSKVMERLTNISGGVQLSMASRLYVSNRFKLYAGFDEKVRAIFKSSCVRIDFKNAEKTAASINKWVSSQTKGKITGLIQPNQVQESTSVLILNAIYFHGLWEHPFESVKEKTFKAPGQDIKVDMMTVKAYFNYTRNDEHSVEIIQIPYSGNEVSFVIMLPFEDIELNEFVKKSLAEPQIWNKLFKSMRGRTLQLSIPKFKTSTKLDLNNIYKKVGLKDIFEHGNSILTKVIHNHKVYVSQSVHAAVIEVDKTGTTASAASAIQIVSLSAKPPPTVVTVDRPFLYFVLANTEQLFAGIYTGL